MTTMMRWVSKGYVPNIPGVDVIWLNYNNSLMTNDMNIAEIWHPVFSCAARPQPNEQSRTVFLCPCHHITFMLKVHLVFKSTLVLVVFPDFVGAIST